MRRRPITRDEIRISYYDFHVLTMPADSVRTDEYGFRPETIERLWKPLIAKLIKEQAEHEASPEIQARNERWNSFQGFKTPPLTPPSMPHPRGYARTCRHCEREFYNVGRRRFSPSRYCRDACAAAAEAPRRAARVAAMVKARSEDRAKARADRTCPICGEPIDAQRATKQFCSTKCRMRSHRQVGLMGP